MERDVSRIIHIPLINTSIGNCFLACVAFYINYLFGEYIPLLSITWYFEYKEMNDISAGIGIINYEQLRKVVNKKYGINLSLLQVTSKPYIHKLIEKNIEQGIPIGLTVDYRRCPWTKSTFTKKYVYHFILIIGYTKEDYICIDNETSQYETINKEVVLYMLQEILMFSYDRYIENPIDRSIAIYDNEYLQERKHIAIDLKRLEKNILTKYLFIDYEECLLIAAKLKVLSINYKNFHDYLCEYSMDSEVKNIASKTSEAFMLLSMLIIKLKKTKRPSLYEKIEEQFEVIRNNEHHMLYVMEKKDDECKRNMDYEL